MTRLSVWMLICSTWAWGCGERGSPVAPTYTDPAVESILQAVEEAECLEEP